jgi:hypothetical protein
VRQFAVEIGEIERYPCALRGAEEGIHMRLANASTIRNIDFAPGGIAGTGSLSPRARRTLKVYVVLVKMSFGGVAAPMGAIADAVFRSSNGESKSIRTVERAHEELIAKGYIRTANYRPGERAKGALIFFNMAAFTYWTQKQTGPVYPLPTSSHNVVSRETMCDNSTPTTSCRASEFTTERSQVTPQYLTKSENNKHRAGARAIKTSSRSRRKKNAVLFSLGCVLSVVGDLHRADRRAARARADCEVKALAGGVELVNPSGVDWAYWETRWDEMSIAVRESTIHREILPLLLGRPTPPPAILTASPPPELEELAAAEPPPTSEQIRAVREALEERFTLRESNPAPAPPAANYPEVDSSDSDMRLLIEARERCRARCVNGG